MTKASLTVFVRSRLFAGIVTGIGIMLIVIFIFEAGVFVGFHEAQFSSRWGENYQRNFGGPIMITRGDMPEFDHSLPEAHGAFGTVVSVSSTTLTILGSQKQEQKVVLTDDTVVRDHETSLKPSDLKSGMFVVAIGDPDDSGEVTAKLIRVMPAPPAQTMTTNSTWGQ